MNTLFVEATTTLGKEGNGSVILVPVNETWDIRSNNVRCSSHKREASCLTFTPLGGLNTTYDVEGSSKGSSGDTNNTSSRVNNGTPIVIAWVGGDAGATATATLRGYRLDKDMA